MKLSRQQQNDLIDLYLNTDSGRSFQFPSNADEEKEYLGLAVENKVGAFLYLQIIRNQLAVSDSLKNSLEDIYKKILSKNTKRLEAGLPVLNDLQKNGVDVIILKGNAIAEDVYGDIGYKPMNDIDILIKKADLEKAHEVFQRHELLTAAPLDEDIKKQEKISHHWPPFFDRKLNVFFGTHWDISAPLRGIKSPVVDFWNEKEAFKLNGNTFFRLSPMHFLFHLCVHLGAAKTGLREVADIVWTLQKREKDLNAAAFLKMVREAKAEDDVFGALILADSLKHFKFVKDVLSELEKTVPLHIKDKCKRRASPRYKILHIRTNYISKIEKTFALFMLTENPVEKTLLLSKMWKLYLFVDTASALKLNYEMPDVNIFKKLRVKLFAPLKISQVFIEDLGLPIFIIVTMRHQWILFLSYLNFLKKKLKGEKIIGLNEYAESLGLSFKEIKEVSALD